MDDVDLSKPLIISACDNGLIYNQEKFIELTKDNSVDIIVWGCRNYPGAANNPKMYGWIEEKDSIIKKIHVKNEYKNPKIDPIVTGTFYFKKAEIFREIGEDLLRSGKKI